MPSMVPTLAVTAVDLSVLLNLGHQRGRCWTMMISIGDLDRKWDPTVVRSRLRVADDGRRGGRISGNQLVEPMNSETLLRSWRTAVMCGVGSRDARQQSRNRQISRVGAVRERGRLMGRMPWPSPRWQG